MLETKKAIEHIGLPHMTVANLTAHMQSHAPLNRSPSKATVRRLLKEEFQLRFRVASAANIKYNDVSFDEKRLWVSRLLAQFMLSGVVIVSIDESSFKSESVVKRYW